MNTTNSIQFLDGAGLAVLSGASLAVTVITNTVHALLKRTTPWIPFATSVAIVVAVTLATSAAHDAMSWLLVLINACLLFCTAAGIQGVIGQVAAPSSPSPAGATASFAAHWTRGWLGRNSSSAA